MTQEDARGKLIVALDMADLGKVDDLARELAPFVGVFKIGPALLFARGTGIIERLKKLGRKLFIDFKFYDIPETVSGICREASRLGVDFVTLHTAGGVRMMEAARKAVSAGPSGERMKLLGVTVLTSFNQEQLAREWKLAEPIEERVMALAGLAREAGMDGVVCSPLELGRIRRVLGEGMVTVVPGIRSAQDSRGDQARTLSPAQAVAAGADYIVVGRPIMASPSPAKAAERILMEMAQVS